MSLYQTLQHVYPNMYNTMNIVIHVHVAHWPYYTRTLCNIIWHVGSFFRWERNGTDIAVLQV